MIQTVFTQIPAGVKITATLLSGEIIETKVLSTEPEVMHCRYKGIKRDIFKAELKEIICHETNGRNSYYRNYYKTHKEIIKQRNCTGKVRPYQNRQCIERVIKLLPKLEDAEMQHRTELYLNNLIRKIHGNKYPKNGQNISHDLHK